MLDNITPVILTFNEGANLDRTLSKLSWARDIVVVDSHSTDETVQIAAKHPAVRVVTRAFDCHANQWNFAIAETGVRTEWILALDADYVLSDDLVRELRALTPDNGANGFVAHFRYCIDGKPLRTTLYPPVTSLFRRRHARYVQDGHTQRVQVDGSVRALTSHIYHDDRKDLSAWVASQDRYARIEAEKYFTAGWRTTRWTERLRAMRVVAPFAMLGYCLFVRGLILDGWPGIFFSFQRGFAELLLSLHLIQRDLSLARTTRAPK